MSKTVSRGTKGNRPRPAQGNHTNDRYPKVIAAGGDNVHVNSGPKPVANNRKRGYAS